MRLLSPEHFNAVMTPLANRRVGYVRPYGNVGDALIETATVQLFNEFGVRWQYLNPEHSLDGTVEHVVFGGGGNMGTQYRDNWILRGRALGLGLPMTIFPQSFTDHEGREYSTVFVRERASLRYCPEGRLAPDMALGLSWPRRTIPAKTLGVFLRHDDESAAPCRWKKKLWNRDPARLCRTPDEYLELAASHRQLITDRLHFAICGLIAGSEVVLLANSYHKNRSMHETWLASLGCQFAATAQAAVELFAAKRFVSRIPSRKAA